MTTTPLTEQQLDEITARANAATKGPWGFYDGDTYADVAADLEMTGRGSYSARQMIARLEDENYWDDPAHEEHDEERAPEQMAANAAFIAAARTDVPLLLAEIRRQRTDLAATEMLAPQQCPAGLHADWLVDSEYAHACPWCRIAELEVGLNDLAALVSQWYDRAKKAEARVTELAALPDRLEAVLTERYTALGNPFSRMDVHKQGPDGWPMSTPVSPNDVAGVARELLATPAPAPAPLDASRGPAGDRDGETGTEPTTGPLDDSAHPLTNATPHALLRHTEHYLSVSHHTRHDTLAANYGCAGCELRDAIRKQQDAAAEEATR